jgi:hypothetical protein
VRLSSYPIPSERARRSERVSDRGTTNSRHGTGHGVGSFLNVHEGPMGIGTRIAYNDVKIAAGHVLSNEPGYYEDGASLFLYFLFFRPRGEQELMNIFEDVQASSGSGLRT